MTRLAALLTIIGLVAAAGADVQPATVREEISLDGPWEFSVRPESAGVPITGDEGGWQPIAIPHTWNRREDFFGPTGDLVRHRNAWYRKRFEIPAADAGKRIYLRFGGVSVIADVYVNGVHLGQHRGAFTRFVFDASRAIRFGGENVLAVKVDNDAASTEDTLPSGVGKQLYEMFGGIYRKVSLLKTHAYHISPLDLDSSGVYITPLRVSASEARFSIRTLLRFAPNVGKDLPLQVRHHVYDAAGKETLALDATVRPFTNSEGLRAAGTAGTEAVATATLPSPRLWGPRDPHLYTVRTELWVDGTCTDVVIERTGFRFFEMTDRQFRLNGVPLPLRGVNKHQENERELIAVSDEKIRDDFRLLQDLGVNYVRLSHYPHPELTYRLADEMGIVLMTENGNSNQGMATTTGETITREMVRQNYNHPSIVFWSAGNEANQLAAERYAAVIRSEDTHRLITYVDGGDWPGSDAFDFVGRNRYHGWYEGKNWDFENWVDSNPYVAEAGASGDPGVHMEYGDVVKETTLMRPHVYEPEEYQQYQAETRFQVAFRTKADRLPMFTWWVFRDFNCQIHYKKTNTKGLLTLGNGKRDIYYLYRSFLRPDDPIVHIASKRYFVRQGSATNGIKVYSNRPELTMTVNGRSWGTQRNGQYHSVGHVVDNVFFWTQPLDQGTNYLVVSDGQGHEDRTVIVFAGPGSRRPAPEEKASIRNLTSNNPRNPAYYIDQPVQSQWSFYYGDASNELDEIPAALDGASWIATRRLSDPANETKLRFTAVRDVDVFVMAAGSESMPALLTEAGFTDGGVTGEWRNDLRTLVPYRLYRRRVARGEAVNLGQASIDYLVLVKSLN